MSNSVSALKSTRPNLFASRARESPFSVSRTENYEILVFEICYFVYAKRLVSLKMFVPCTQNRYLWGGDEVTPAGKKYKSALSNVSTLSEHNFVSSFHGLS